MDDGELGRRIAYWRERRGVTQRLLADRIGRSKSWIEKVEAGKRSASRLPILLTICQELRVDLPVLIGRDVKRDTRNCIDDAQVDSIRVALETFSSPACPQFSEDQFSMAQNLFITKRIVPWLAQGEPAAACRPSGLGPGRCGDVAKAGAQIGTLNAWHEQEVRNRQAASEEERTSRMAEDQRIRDRMADLAGGGLKLQAWGVVCLLAGTLITAIW